ncbi:DUF1956 domain-containing protein [Paracoccus marinaquae]|uniref:CerR family C-terminal domain-containing protein n=1 Tax=Paracoccus marinaquae TaxID=2841926 RepID=A0ABS6AMU1_9RHOB|nr:DUF1956 domain-containing protein [Paracoccus marinaquae]MBU3030955.1 CerR family C-terminal domain-containing protein [Paracoccus marinaquae]
MEQHPTRLALIDAAMRQFGRDGFDAASTRAIAAAAETNISSIAYHFGGKEGLRMACADMVAQRIVLISRPLAQIPGDASPAMARATLRRLMRRVVCFLVLNSEAQDTVAFMLRELAQPDSPVLDRLYSQLVEPRHRALCQLWSLATGRPAEADAVKLAVFSLIGQAFYFRLAAPIVQRRMGWSDYTPGAARAIARQVLDNLEAMIGDGHG